MIAMEKLEKLTRQTLPALVVVSGEDFGQYQLMKEKLLDALGYRFGDLSVSYFDIAETPYETVEMDLLSMPFFAEEKIILLDHFLDLTTAKKSYWDDAELKRFEAYLENPLETNRVIIFAPGKLDSKRRLVKLLKRDGLHFEAIELKPTDLVTYFQKQAHQLGLSFSKGVFDELVMLSSGSFSEMAKNLVFLQGYKPTGQITYEDLAMAIPRSLQDNLFDVTTFVLQGKLEQAKQLVHDLTLQGEDEIKLLAIMLGQFRLYTQVKLLLAKGRSESALVSELSEITGRKVNPYQVKFALRDSRSLSVAFLKKAMEVLIVCDYQMKSGLYDKSYLFEVALLKLASMR